jgi:thiamine biosynthesis lipoprotein
MLDWTFRAMGTTWRIHHSGGVSGETAQRVADAVAADERRWSRVQPQSDVARISRGAGTPVDVAPETIELIEAAVMWTRDTAGVFQPLVGTQLARWGYRRELGDATTAPAGAAVPDAGCIVIAAGDRTVQIPAGSELDLGGIGKSWAAARAGRLLAELVGDARLIIDAGGDLALVRGAHAINTAAGSVPALAGEGVATSSSERRSWVVPEAGDAHHLIDPALGVPGARGTAVVVGADPVAADVLASCLVLRPNLLDALEQPAARVDLDGTIRTNAAWTVRCDAA